ncbi:hypothetical protein [Streptomyces ardesiacus]|uniref:hypothetical protein n=1 Tax=Streptomyces ardesiacus TaxID=285564 RepID=UPI00201EDAB0|nr:hypothetical protein [Streptomyces ardesiacus]MCL7370515.1 hypothetical protein [Streptomyces ardesiacus]
MTPTPTTRRPREAEAIADFFSLYGLPHDSVEALSEISRLRRRNRGRPLMLPAMKFAYFLVDGCISETVQAGKTRLWRELMLFEGISNSGVLPGSFTEERINPLATNLTHGSTLTRCVFIEVPNIKLSALASSDPAIALMLARMAAKRGMLTERLYTATRASPVARVAAVLNYLAAPTRKKVIRRRQDGELVMSTTEELVASGPSQVDLSDALCLGRATVEKAIAELRQTGALRSFTPGERTNRCYPIQDRDLLRQIAMGG